ncbi:MAG: ATP-dependent Clp protease proteolytic subunit [bacterium]|jgi:ATP-dependent Clp protease protease subunit
MAPAPFVIKPFSGESFLYDIYARLLEERIVFLFGPIDDELSDSVVAQLLYLDALGDKKDVYMYINSPGGSITSGMAILDTMRAISCEITTVCIGQAASMGAILMLGGTKGKRISLPNSRFLIHQPLGGAIGTSTDIEIQTAEIVRMKEILNRMISEETGQPYDKVVKDTDRDNFMSAQEAKKYGLIDKIVQQLPGRNGKK